MYKILSLIKNCEYKIYNKEVIMYYEAKKANRRHGL